MTVLANLGPLYSTFDQSSCLPIQILLETILGIPRILEFINNPHVEEEEEVTEQVDGIDRDPAEKESNAYAPQSFVITYEWYIIYNI